MQRTKQIEEFNGHHNGGLYIDIQEIWLRQCKMECKVEMIRIAKRPN